MSSPFLETVTGQQIATTLRSVANQYELVAELHERPFVLANFDLFPATTTVMGHEIPCRTRLHLETAEAFPHYDFSSEVAFSPSAETTEMLTWEYAHGCDISPSLRRQTARYAGSILRLVADFAEHLPVPVTSIGGRLDPDGGYIFIPAVRPAADKGLVEDIRMEDFFGQLGAGWSHKRPNDHNYMAFGTVALDAPDRLQAARHVFDVFFADNL